MGNKPSTVNPAHWSIYERTIKIKDPVDLAKVAQSILTKPQLVNTAREHGVLGWLQTVAAYTQPPTKKEIAISRLTDMVVHPFPAKLETDAFRTSRAGSELNPFPAKLETDAFESDEKRRRREFEEATAKRHEEFLRKISVVSGGDTAYHILGIKRGATPEEVKRAYRKAALATHPDKPGGSEEAFDKITKAFASISEDLKHGSMPSTTKHGGKESYKSTEFDNVSGKVAFGLLNPDKFDINMFNKIFEATKIEEPDEGGYDDWLKSDDAMNTMPVFSGKYNRALFNKMFEDHALALASKTDAIATYTIPIEICTTNRVGHSELGGGRVSDYTSATGSGMHYTDLRAAFTDQTSLGTFDPRASEKMQRKTVQQYERERAAAMAKPMTAEEREYDRLREEHEIAQERERSARLRERDNRYAALQDRMKHTRLLPDQLSKSAIMPGNDRLAIMDSR